MNLHFLLTEFSAQLMNSNEEDNDNPPPARRSNSPPPGHQNTPPLQNHRNRPPSPDERPGVTLPVQSIARNHISWPDNSFRIQGENSVTLNRRVFNNTRFSVDINIREESPPRRSPPRRPPQKR